MLPHFVKAAPETLNMNGSETATLILVYVLLCRLDLCRLYPVFDIYLRHGLCPCLCLYPVLDTAPDLYLDSLLLLSLNHVCLLQATANETGIYFLIVCVSYRGRDRGLCRRLFCWCYCIHYFCCCYQHLHSGVNLVLLLAVLVNGSEGMLYRDLCGPGLVLDRDVVVSLVVRPWLCSAVISVGRVIEAKAGELRARVWSATA